MIRVIGARCDGHSNPATSAIRRDLFSAGWLQYRCVKVEAHQRRLVGVDRNGNHKSHTDEMEFNVSWNISFKVENGKVDLESIQESGTPPEGNIYLNGHGGPDSVNFGLTLPNGNITASLILPKAKE